MFRFTLSAIKYKTKYEIRKSIPFGSIFDLFLLFGLKTRCVNFYSSPDEETFGTGACFYFLLAKVSLRPERTWKHSWERLINTDHELSHTQIISASMSVPLTVCVYVCDFNSLSLPSDLLKRTVHPKMKTVVIYSPSCRSEPVWLSFFSETQNDSVALKANALPESERWANHSFESDLFSESVEVQNKADWFSSSTHRLCDLLTAQTKGRISVNDGLDFGLFFTQIYLQLQKTWNIGKRYGSPLWCFYVTPHRINCNCMKKCSWCTL